MAHSFTLLKAEVKVLQEANALKKKEGKQAKKAYLLRRKPYRRRRSGNGTEHSNSRGGG
jgi:hypothetical protein